MGNEKEDVVKEYLTNLTPESDNTGAADSKIKIKAGRDFVAGDKIHIGNKPEVTNRNSNVINLNVSQGKEADELTLSGETISWQQQEEIRELVRRITELTGLAHTKIWQKFSAHFDGIYYKKLPIERYREAAQWLSAWIERLDAQPQEKAQVTATPVAEKTKSTNSKQFRCPRCDLAQQKIALTRKIVLGSSLLAVVALGTATFFWVNAWQQGKAVQALQASRYVCEFDGKPYSIGGIIDNPQAPDIECVGSTNGDKPHWQAMTSPVPVKRPVQRRPARPAFAPAQTLSEQ